MASFKEFCLCVNSSNLLRTSLALGMCGDKLRIMGRTTGRRSSGTPQCIVVSGFLRQLVPLMFSLCYETVSVHVPAFKFSRILAWYRIATDTECGYLGFDGRHARRL